MVYRYLLIVIKTDVQSVIKVVFVKAEGFVAVKADIHVPLGRNADFTLLMHDVNEGLKLSYLAVADADYRDFNFGLVVEIRIAFVAFP